MSKPILILSGSESTTTEVACFRDRIASRIPSYVFAKYVQVTEQQMSRCSSSPEKDLKHMLHTGMLDRLGVARLQYSIQVSTTRSQGRRV